MMSLFCPEMTIFKGEDAGFEKNILRQCRATLKFQELPPLTTFLPFTKTWESEFYAWYFPNIMSYIA